MTRKKMGMWLRMRVFRGMMTGMLWLREHLVYEMMMKARLLRMKSCEIINIDRETGVYVLKSSGFVLRFILRKIYPNVHFKYLFSYDEEYRYHVYWLLESIRRFKIDMSVPISLHHTFMDDNISRFTRERHRCLRGINDIIISCRPPNIANIILSRFNRVYSHRRQTRY